MDLQRIDEIKGQRIVVIDLDTGTILGTNLVLAYISSRDEEEITSSDDAAIAHGKTFGLPLLVDFDV